MTREELVVELKNWYNGFRFSPNAETVYSPVSVALFFEKKQGFLNYWSNTGNPAHVTELIRRHKLNITSILSQTYDKEMLEICDISNISNISNIEPEKILYQAGYLTIKSSEFWHGRYRFRLGFPNFDVGESFNICLLSCYKPTAQVDITESADRFKDALVARNWEAVMAEMNIYFAQFNYQITHNKASEYVFQALFICFCVTYTIHPECEVATNQGRIDAVIRLEGRIFIFEFKLDNNRTVLSTIKKRQYYQKYLYSTSEITLVGVNFSTETSNVIKIESEDIDKSHPLLIDGSNA